MDKRIINIAKFAIEKHRGQKDKAGLDYIYHPFTVAFMCKDVSAKVVALLHDTLEDTDATIEDFKKLGLTDAEIDAIVLLTKPEKEDYMHYVKRVAKNPIAREVKMCDLTHNMDLSRLPKVTEKDIKRVEKYKKAFVYLEQYANKDFEEER